MSDELRAALAKRSSGNHAPAELLLIDESTELAAMQERRLVKAAFELSGVCTSMIALRSSRRFPDVYPLQADTRFLMQVLVDHLDDFVGEMRSPGLLVEVGCGAAPSATLLSRLAPSAAVMGVDISLSAMRAARELTSASHAEVHLARMDLLAALRPASVDLLVFMPPYVPSTEAAFAEAMSSASSVETPVDSLEQAAWVWSGGPGGLAILERLVSRDLDRVLAEGGVFVCLVPAHDGGRSAAEAIKRACSGGFTARVIARHNEDLKGGWAGGWAVLQIERD